VVVVSIPSAAFAAATRPAGSHELKKAAGSNSSGLSLCQVVFVIASDQTAERSLAHGKPLGLIFRAKVRDGLQQAGFSVQVAHRLGRHD